MLNKSILLLAILVSGFSTNIWAEEVVLKTGEKVEGKIIEQTDQYIKMDTGVGVNITYYTDDIDTIDGQQVQKPQPAPVVPPQVAVQPVAPVVPEEQTGQNQDQSQPQALPSYQDQPQAQPSYQEQPQPTYQYHPQVTYQAPPQYTYARSSTSSSGKDVLLSVFALVFGVFSFFHGFTVMRKKKMIESIPTSTVRGTALGLVELTGKAKAPKLLLSPLTMTECAYYRFTIERYQSSGRSGHWVLISSGDSAVSPFCLDDGTGQITVLPKGAEFIMPADFSFSTGLGNALPENLLNFMDKNGVQYRALLGNYSLRFHEWYIRPEEDVFVVGTAQNNTTQPDGPKVESTNLDLIVAQGEDKQIFIVSDESQTQVLKSFSWQSFLGIWGGSALSLAMLAYLLFRFNLL